ncbi:MAG TPA: transglutaminase-like domain-containing protein [Chitinophagaceae bacterium]|nr:transglutaminase-like domain-containing protein [Chitinophagaceae bacterium]
MKKLICFITGFACLAGVFGQNAEKWFVSNMAGQPIGYSKEIVKVKDDKTVTENAVKLIFNRKKSKVVFFTTSEISENSKGEFISGSLSNKTTGQEVKLTAVLVNDSIEIVTVTGGQTYKSKIAVKETLLGPATVKKKSKNELRKAGDSITYSMFSPDFGIIIHTTRKLLAIDNVNTNRGNITVFKIRETFKENPYPREIWVDENYEFVKMIDPSPFGNIESNLSVKEVAETAGEGTILPAESFGSTAPPSNVRFTDPRNIEQVVFKVTLKNKSVKFPDLTTARQKVLEQGSDYAIVQYTRPPLPKKADDNNTYKLADFLSPNAFTNSDYPEIIKLAEEITKNKKTNFEKAVAIKNWISANVKGDLGVAFAPGSEVFKTRRGTCMAFSTFFASLLRAAKVPAKYMLGYVYMNGIWGGHAWIEVYTNGSWIPMDATINTTNIADAARLSFSDGKSINEGTFDFTSGASTFFGNSDIKVLSYTINGKKNIVANEAKLYTVENNSYYNPGKKFRINKTNEFEFKNLDELWPSPVFATLSFKDGEVKIMDGYWRAPLNKEEAIKDQIEAISKSKIQKTLNFNKAKIYIMDDVSKAFYAVIRGQDMLLFYANGKTPVEKLKTIILNTQFE